MSDVWTDRLSEYLDDELPPGERVALEGHLAQCAECSATLADLRHSMNLRTELPISAAGPRCSYTATRVSGKFTILTSSSVACVFM